MDSIKKILVTGGAGFIGYHVVKNLCESGVEVVCLDNLNDYYDVSLKNWRLSQLQAFKGFSFIKCDIEEKNSLEHVFSSHRFDAVINLAARAGVSYSLENPSVYVTTNILGTLNLLEYCRKHNISKFVLASTSSLYAGQELPFKEDVPVTTPLSPYAATKGGAESLAYTYHHLFGIDLSVLRYFTVYGPAGRPDMSYFRFIKSALQDKVVHVNGDGSQSRDFTYVEDVVDGTIRALKTVGYQIINLGGNEPHTINEMIKSIGDHIGKRIGVDHGPFLKEDMRSTYASIDKAKLLLDWSPRVNFSEGIGKTVEWFLSNRELVNSIAI